MLFKQLKHDLLFGRTMFVSLGIFIVCAAVTGQFFYRVIGVRYIAYAMLNICVLLTMGVVIGFVTIHLSQFIDKSMYGDSGHLTLTLPVPRGRLLVSKLIAAWLWFNFLLLAVLVGIFILRNTSHNLNMSRLLPDFSPALLTYYLNMTFAFFFLVNLLFFGRTLNNSVFAGIKIPNFFTAILCLVVAFGYFAAVIRLYLRNVAHVMLGSWIILFERILFDLYSGRLPLLGSHFYVYTAAIGLILGLAAFAGTWYLLEKKVSLQ